MNSPSEGHHHALAVFAHELREPLTSILLAAQALGESSATEGAQTSLHGLSGVIQRQGQYLARLIDAVLQASRHTEPSVLLSKEWFDLHQIVLATLETISPILHGRDHHLAVSVPREPIYLFADPLRMQQVLTNLLINAAKYTERGGSIWLTVTETPEHLSIAVRDNGIGIAAALLPRVFDLFEQGERASSNEYTGLGVGLAVVKELVEGHGGDVTAHSAGLNCGSTFVVRFPSFPADACGERAPHPARRQRHASTLDPSGESAMLDA